MLYLSVIFPFIAYFLKTKNTALKIAVATAPAIFIILFRFGLGTDYFSYEFLFNQHNVETLKIAMNAQAYAMEPGLRLVIYIFKSLNLSFQIFIATLSLIIYIFFAKWIFDTKQNFYLSIMLFNGMFFIVWALSGIRQGLVLAIGTYLFFNKKSKLNLWQSIIVIILLAQMHTSAYIYLLVIFAKKIKFNKKQLTLILATSLLMSFIPYQIIFSRFNHIELIAKYSKYFSKNIGFLDFSGLVRLAFASFVLIFYDHFKKDTYTKQLANFSILGFSSYFFLKSSEIIASRINIFTFILIIPLLVYLSQTYFTKKSIKILATLALFGFSMLYLEKDLLAHQSQVEVNNPSLIYKMKTINNVELTTYLDYDNKYTFPTYQAKYCQLNKKIQSPIKPDQNLKQYIAIKDDDTGLYGILKGDGTWQIAPTFKEKPLLLKDIIIVEEENKTVYYNLDKTVISDVESDVETLKIEAQKIKDEKPKRSLSDYSTYSDTLDQFFANENTITEVLILHYTLPFEHSILRVNNGNRFSFFTLNKDLEINHNFLYKRAIRYDINNMAFGNTYCGYTVLNSDGDIVWIYK